MNSTQQPTAVDADGISSSSRHRPRASFVRRLGLMLASLLTASGAVVLVPAPADAYINMFYSGRQGPIRFGYTGPAVVAHPGYRFVTPVMIIYRNGAINADYQQELTVQFQLQRWNGRGWTVVDGLTQRRYLDLGATGSAIAGNNSLVSSVTRPGYFRVVTTVSWGNAAAVPYWSSGYTGHQRFKPSYARDMRCALAQCQNRVVANGSLYVWG